MHTVPTTIKNKELVEKKREQIINAAIKLFPKKGYHKTTLRDLADEAGISHGNIYDYVGSKEDIFLLVHGTITGLADEALVRSIENIDDPLERLRRMIHSEFDLSYNWSDAILFVYQDIHVLSRPLLKKLLKKESGHVARFQSVLDECISKGLLRDCNTRVVANLIKIMIDSWVIKRFLIWYLMVCVMGKLINREKWRELNVSRVS
jgi:AcrR family transcriptional regulator